MKQAKVNRKASARRDYEKNREAYLRRAARHAQRSYEDRDYRVRSILRVAKYRAKRKGIVFALQAEDIKWNDVCPVLHIPIVLDNHGIGRQAPTSPSLDKIENDKGYVKGNVRIVSNRANMLKSDMTREEAKLLYENWDKT